MKTNYRRKNRKKEPYRGSKTIDYSCRNHGSCGVCKDNRLHHRHKVEEEAKEEVEEYFEDEHA